ncbi:MAG: arylamine N-acetyltransferase [Candidatus Marinimicrobia bacterium]|nr:arylamine N-acetyltransferase [Candidatus Neomarinimicrobiota bacterium]MCF7827430.1 arylamine N-acetyltransferase [Candidatus Neomarinimicrobiota bacterium]MCF7881337.1 arylamine N-acetyltransferase [Candidatus Neomarinimicrobiota bacterium]
MMTVITPDRLAPGKHFGEARQFLGHFGIQEQSPTLDHLETIAQEFSRIPYENISKIINFAKHGEQTGFRLPDTIYEDYRNFRLGGTCFSLTWYLLEILRNCGYDCDPILGDMKWGKNVHSAILVYFNEGVYLVDPGYMIHQPLLISQDTQQRHLTPHSGIEIRFNREVERYDVYTFRNGNFTWRYRFTASGVDSEEFSQHWIASFTKPTMNGIILTRTAGGEMIYIHDDFTKVTGHEKVQRHKSRDVAEKLILNEFGIPLDLVEEARHSLEINREVTKETVDATD